MNINPRVISSLLIALLFHVVIGVALYNVFKPAPEEKDNISDTTPVKDVEKTTAPADTEEFVIAPPDNRARASSVRQKATRGAGSAKSNKTKSGRAENNRKAARTHTVKAGESYWVIARKYDITIENLMDSNGLDTRHILQIGEKLRIPE